VQTVTVEFETYKLMVEDIRDVQRARRETVTTYVTLNIAGIGAIGFLGSDNQAFDPALVNWLVIGLVLVCFLWQGTERAFLNQLARKYHHVIKQADRLGLDPEWTESIMRWTGRPARTYEQAAVQRLMPFLFMLGYVIFLLHQISADQLLAPMRDLFLRR
jgi:hypothetical protein